MAEGIIAGMTQPYYVIAMNPDDGTEQTRAYTATSLTEALCMAERDDAGRRTRLYGVRYADYDLARTEGIQFNEADGLLLD